MQQNKRRLFVAFTAKMPLRTANSESSFQGFVLALRHCVMNPDQDAHQYAFRELPFKYNSS